MNPLHWPDPADLADPGDPADPRQPRVVTPGPYAPISWRTHLRVAGRGVAILVGYAWARIRCRVTGCVWTTDTWTTVEHCARCGDLRLPTAHNSDPVSSKTEEST